MDIENDYASFSDILTDKYHYTLFYYEAMSWQRHLFNVCKKQQIYLI